jgi:hypothetical protein
MQLAILLYFYNFDLEIEMNVYIGEGGVAEDIELT